MWLCGLAITELVRRTLFTGFCGVAGVVACLASLWCLWVHAINTLCAGHATLAVIGTARACGTHVALILLACFGERACSALDRGAIFLIAVEPGVTRCARGSARISSVVTSATGSTIIRTKCRFLTLGTVSRGRGIEALLASRTLRARAAVCLTEGSRWTLYAIDLIGGIFACGAWLRLRGSSLGAYGSSRALYAVGPVFFGVGARLALFRLRS